MTIETIASEVQKIKKRYKESDPERLCREMGILIKRIPMGKGEKVICTPNTGHAVLGVFQ